MPLPDQKQLTENLKTEKPGRNKMPVAEFFQVFLSDAGVTDEYFAQMTEDAMKSGNIAVNPRKTVREDILALYKEVL